MYSPLLATACPGLSARVWRPGVAGRCTHRPFLGPGRKRLSVLTAVAALTAGRPAAAAPGCSQLCSCRCREKQVPSRLSLSRAHKGDAYLFEVQNDDVAGNKPQSFQTEQAMMAKYNQLLRESNLTNDLKSRARFERPRDKKQRRRQERIERRKWEHSQPAYVPETLQSAGGPDMVLEEPFFDFFSLRASWDKVTDYDEPSWQQQQAQAQLLQQQMDYGHYAYDPNNVIDIGGYMDMAGMNADAAADMGGYLNAGGGGFNVTGGYMNPVVNPGSYANIAAATEPYAHLLDMEALAAGTAAAAAAAPEVPYWQQQQQQPTQQPVMQQLQPLADDTFLQQQMLQQTYAASATDGGWGSWGSSAAAAAAVVPPLAPAAAAVVPPPAPPAAPGSGTYQDLSGFALNLPSQESAATVPTAKPVLQQQQQQEPLGVEQQPPSLQQQQQQQAGDELAAQGVAADGMLSSWPMPGLQTGGYGDQEQQQQQQQQVTGMSFGDASAWQQAWEQMQLQQQQLNAWQQQLNAATAAAAAAAAAAAPMQPSAMQPAAAVSRPEVEQLPIADAPSSTATNPVDVQHQQAVPAAPGSTVVQAAAEPLDVSASFTTASSSLGVPTAAEPHTEYLLDVGEEAVAAAAALQLEATAEASAEGQAAAIPGTVLAEKAALPAAAVAGGVPSAAAAQDQEMQEEEQQPQVHQQPKTVQQQQQQQQRRRRQPPSRRTAASSTAAPTNVRRPPQAVAAAPPKPSTAAAAAAATAGAGPALSSMTAAAAAVALKEAQAALIASRSSLQALDALLAAKAMKATPQQQQQQQPASNTNGSSSSSSTRRSGSPGQFRRIGSTQRPSSSNSNGNSSSARPGQMAAAGPDSQAGRVRQGKGVRGSNGRALQEPIVLEDIEGEQRQQQRSAGKESLV